VEDRRERLEDDTLLGVLQTQTLSLVLVLPIERLDRDVVSERVVQILHALDVELDVCRKEAKRGSSSAQVSFPLHE
jgi:hypothetical protein